MVHEDNPDIIWSHSVKATISKIRSLANAVANIQDGHGTTTLPQIEKRLWDVAHELDNHCDELFIEIKRLHAGESEGGKDAIIYLMVAGEKEKQSHATITDEEALMLAFTRWRQAVKQGFWVPCKIVTLPEVLEEHKKSTSRRRSRGTHE